jgi:hypothetical protein
MGIFDWFSGGDERPKDRLRATIDADPTAVPIDLMVGAQWIGEDELGNALYRGATGQVYTVPPLVQREPEQGDPAYKRAYDALTSDPIGVAKGIGAGLLESVVDGVSAPGRALAGEPVTLGDVWSTAALAQAGAAPMAVPEGALVAGAMRRDPRMWHPASDIKLQRPVDEMTFGITDKGDLSPAQTIDISGLEGRVLVPAFGDRTRAGGLLTSINDEDLLRPVDLQGGADFMRSQGGIWASEPDAMKTKAKYVLQTAQDFGDAPVLAYTAMGAQSGDFSRMMSDAVMGQLRPSMGNMIDPAAVSRFDDYVTKNVDPKWPGILSTEASDYIPAMTGSNRRLLWQEMDKGVYREAGFPDIGATRLAITDPRLVNAQPFDTGLTFGRVDVDAPLTETTPDVHATYRSQIHGDYLGGLLGNVPGDMVWRDFFNARRAAGTSPATDQRAFMMTPSVLQKVDAQMVEEISRYLEALSQGSRP